MVFNILGGLIYDNKGAQGFPEIDYRIFQSWILVCTGLQYCRLLNILKCLDSDLTSCRSCITPSPQPQHD